MNSAENFSKTWGSDLFLIFTTRFSIINSANLYLILQQSCIFCSCSSWQFPFQPYIYIESLLNFYVFQSIQLLLIFVFLLQAFLYFSENRQIQWVAGKPPKSEPRCGFEGEKCVHKPDWRTISICSIAAAVLAVVLVMAARYILSNYKYYIYIFFYVTTSNNF